MKWEICYAGWFGEREVFGQFDTYDEARKFFRSVKYHGIRNCDRNLFGGGILIFAVVDGKGRKTILET